MVSVAYAGIAQRALAQITRKGAAVVFPSASGRVYDEDTDRWIAGTPTTITGRAVQTEGDPDRFSALGLVLTDPVTLLVAGIGFTDAAGASVAFEPALGAAFDWVGKRYTVRDLNPTAPDGSAIVWEMTGSR